MDIVGTVQAGFTFFSGVCSPSMLLVFVISFLFFYLIFEKSDLPPGPLKLPIVGNAWWFLNQRKKENIPIAVYEAWKEYGDVIHITAGTKDVIFLNGYDAIHEAFVVRSDDFSTRPKWMVEAAKADHGIVFENGKKWKALRKFTLLTLREFGVGKSSLEEKIGKEIDATTQVFINNNGEPTETGQLTSMIITNVIYGIIFGKRLEYTSNTLEQVLSNLNTLFRDGAPIGFTSLLPKFIWKIVGNEEQFNAIARQQAVFSWMNTHIVEHIQEHRETYDENNIRDFIDLFIQKENEGTENDLFTLTTLYGVIIDLFVAGAETTSNSLNWCILYMQEYPDVQKKCQEEIYEKYGDKQITWSDRGSLPFTEATLLEIQRMSNIAPFSLPHTNEKETTLFGYRIPANSVIQANLLSSNMDPKYWTDPHVFKPERHLDDGKIRKNPAFLSFSIGPRMCLGEMLAKMELFLIVTNLLQRFTFHRENEDVKHSFETIEGQLTFAPIPYKTRAIKRT